MGEHLRAGMQANAGGTWWINTNAYRAVGLQELACIALLLTARG